MDVILLLDSFSAVFFVLLLVVSLWLFRKQQDNWIALYLAAAFLFFSVKEIVYLIADAGLWDPNIKVIGGVMGVFAALMFLYAFVMEEGYMRDIRRIRKAWYD